MIRLSENSVLNIKNRSHAVTADVTIPEDGGRGVVVAQGGAFGGWSVYLQEGVLAYCYNLFGMRLFKAYGEAAVPAGERQLRVEFTYDGGGLGKGGSVELFVDGRPVGRGRVEVTVPLAFSADETLDVGSDSATPVSDDYDPKSGAFTGRVHRVQIDVDENAEDADHLISPEERMRIAVARQ